MRIAMFKLRSVEEQTLSTKIVQNHRVGFFNEHAGIRCFRRHIASAVNELNKRKVIFFADL